MQRKLAAIMAIDMVGFSRLMEIAEEDTIARQKEHRGTIFNPKFEAAGGTIGWETRGQYRQRRAITRISTSAPVSIRPDTSMAVQAGYGSTTNSAWTLRNTDRCC